MRWVAVLMVAIFSLNGCEKIPGTRNYALRNSVETTVKAKLRDPDSAKFTEIEYFVDRDLACGKVNSKNGFGGYVGDMQFAYYQGNAFSLEWGDDPNRYLWVLHECTNEHLEKLKRENPGLKLPKNEKFKPI